MAMTRRTGTGGYTVVTSGGNVLSLVVAVPSSTTDGDLMILTAMTDDQGGTLSISGGGWTEFPTGSPTVATGGCTQAAWFRIASSEPANYTILWDNLSRQMNAVMAVYNPDGGTPQRDDDDGAFETSATSVTTPTISAPNSGTIKFAASAHDSGVTVSSGPSGMSIIGTEATNSSTALVAYDEEDTTGDWTATVTWNGSSDEMAIIGGSFSTGGGAVEVHAGPLVNSTRLKSKLGGLVG